MRCQRLVQSTILTVDTVIPTQDDNPATCSTLYAVGVYTFSDLPNWDAGLCQKQPLPLFFPAKYGFRPIALYIVV